MSDCKRCLVLTNRSVMEVRKYNILHHGYGVNKISDYKNLFQCKFKFLSVTTFDITKESVCKKTRHNYGENKKNICINT